MADAAAVPAGTVTGWALGSLSSLPGVLGAGSVSYGSAAVVHSVFVNVPELPVGLLVAGVFGLLLDRKL